jgi:hypothetical protein
MSLLTPYPQGVAACSRRAPPCDASTPQPRSRSRTTLDARRRDARHGARHARDGHGRNASRLLEPRQCRERKNFALRWIRNHSDAFQFDLEFSGEYRCMEGKRACTVYRIGWSTVKHSIVASRGSQQPGTTGTRHERGHETAHAAAVRQSRPPAIPDPRAAHGERQQIACGWQSAHWFPTPIRNGICRWWIYSVQESQHSS